MYKRQDLNDAAQSGNEDAANAIDVLCYGIAKFVGGYVAAMNGVDAIVFTAVSYTHLDVYKRQVVLFANSSLFWFKVTNEHREFRNYLLHNK